MIGKDKILVLIEKLVKRQKILIPFLGSHLLSSMEFSGLQKKDIEELKLFIKKSALEQKSHLAILEEAYQSLRESKQDVF